LICKIVRSLVSTLAPTLAFASLASFASPRALAAPPAPPSAAPAVKVATGSGLAVVPKPKAPFFDITAYGAASNGPALKNQAAINAAIDAAAAAGGGTVVIPAGVFKTYSIRLKSNVGLHLAAKDSILRAAVPGTGPNQDGGFYDAPEKNLFIGLQDGGHSHWANSLIYGISVHDVMISGPGLIDGSNPAPNGLVVDVLTGGDVRDPAVRDGAGVPGPGNKAIGLENSTNIVFHDIHIKNGGHFAILGTAVDHWTIDNIIVDTDRDAIDIDTCQNMTIRNSVFNSLNDDALVMKGSFGAGKFLDSKNILIENDTVSGYDPGSVLDKTYSSGRLAANDRDGPTGRVKFGTEGTNGLDTVTVRNVTFDRSRGFALESVDGATLQNILFTDVHMKHISSSPIFIVIGDRARAPVTGLTTVNTANPAKDVRLSETGWILPNVPSLYGSYPPTRYQPVYDKSTQVSIGGSARGFSIVNPASPTRLNPASIHPSDPLFANAVYVPFAQVRNIVIRNVTVEDADPRYPILLSGLVGHPIENVSISNVTVEYRGGLTMDQAIEQRQLAVPYTFTAYQSAPATQSLSWLVNTFFSKNEALLPRVSWDSTASSWQPDPYNVPEMPREYPEPSIFGILPAYGLYARHVEGLKLTAVTLKYKIEDKRPAVVLDDVKNASLAKLSVMTAPQVPALVKVTNTRKREADLEFIKDTAYKTTTVTNLTVSPALHTQAVTIDRPSPGTPPDSLYANPTAPSAVHPYSYAIADDKYPLPQTVFPAIFDYIAPQTVPAGQPLQLTVIARSPAPNPTLAYSAAALPAGATFDAATRTLTWTPKPTQLGPHILRFTVDNGAIPETVTAVITVTAKP
jgi:polygalacturonase